MINILNRNDLSIIFSKNKKVSMMAYTIVSPWTDFPKKCSLFVIVLVNSWYILSEF